MLIYALVLFVLLLSSINVDNSLQSKRVLGISSQKSVNLDQEFWQDFLNKNPNYIPGLVETGNLERAHQIDPNYLTP